MYFIIDNERQIIFGWSAKCGCTHLKRICIYLQTGILTEDVHKEYYANSLPHDIQNYTTIVIIRNPYKRLVSGFLDKYRPYGQYRQNWKDSFLSFSKFVDRLVIKDYNAIDYHHFTPQTSEKFDEKIILSKTIKFYDITNIDYAYIEELYNKKIPEDVLKFHGNHLREKYIKESITHKMNVYNLNIDTYIDYNIDIKYFFNEEIKEKVFNFYINDFEFFKNIGFDYKNTFKDIEVPIE